MSGKTAVVIPYYQQEAGILRRAVESAIAQEGVSDLEIIVVDDGSPASARADLRELDLPAHVGLKLIEQPNRGPGAARNHALDSVSADTAYIAFLDSDDRWTADHLRNAIKILQKGYDIYFADGAYQQSNETFFARMKLDLAKQEYIGPHFGYYKFHQDVRSLAINSINPFYMSCVVFRRSALNQLRFHEISFMGEDLTFWMQMAAQTDRIAFRTDVECFAGPGIHIYEESGWATPRAIWRIYHYMKWRKWLHDNIMRTKLEKWQNAREIHKLRRSFIIAMLHEVRRMRAFKNLDIARFFVLDPKVVLYVIPVALQVALSKLRSWSLTD